MSKHVSLTPATALLKARSLVFSEHPYEYLEQGGAMHSSAVLGFSPTQVIKTLIMQDEAAKPLIILMHADKEVSTKNLARDIGVKKVEPCKPEVAERHSGYKVGGTSPFATKRAMPVYAEASIFELAQIYLNGGKRGYLIGIPPAYLTDVLAAKPVHCAL
jgi:Cys-tRNA(Pro) deacylase